MGSVIPSQNDQNLLTAAVSNIMDVHLNGITYSWKWYDTVSLFSYHHKTYSYGLVGDIGTEDDMIDISIKTFTGSTIPCRIDRNGTIEDLKLQIQSMGNISAPNQGLIFLGKQLEDGRQLLDYGIHNGAVLHMVLRLRGGGEDPKILNLSGLDPRYDYDFTNIADKDKQFKRGGLKYVRPCGWKRFAIKVSDKYEDLVWLGHTNQQGEWPVSYHGTGLHHAKTIATDGYDLTRGKRFRYGYGIYSTPDIKVAEKYAVKFSHENIQYLVVLQNRVNPATLEKIPADQTGVGEYWISPNDNDIRPYGICIRKV